MAGRNYTAGGFSFTDEKLADQAKKELEGIQYVKERVDMENPEMALEIYHRMISENLFETPVGFCYLKELQEALRANPRTRTETIREIPVGKSAVVRAEPELQTGKRKIKPEKQVIRKEKYVNYKRRYRMLLTVSIALFVIVLAMFAIEFTSNSPHILNYENEIINKYEEWDRQLKEKEEELKEREEKLLDGQVEDIGRG